jgi:hypothetical protein
MKFQGRFTHLKEEHIAKMQAFVDEKISRIKAIAVEASIPTPKEQAWLHTTWCKTHSRVEVGHGSLLYPIEKSHIRECLPIFFFHDLELLRISLKNGNE